MDNIPRSGDFLLGGIKSIEFCCVLCYNDCESRGIWVRAFEKPFAHGAVCIVIRFKIGAVRTVIFAPIYVGVPLSYLKATGLFVQ